MAKESLGFDQEHLRPSALSPSCGRTYIRLWAGPPAPKWPPSYSYWCAHGHLRPSAVPLLYAPATLFLFNNMFHYFPTAEDTSAPAPKCLGLNG